jgi:transposase-like protein
MDLLRLKCPVCHSFDIQYHSPYTTKNHGSRVIYKCENCPAYFSETKNTFLEGLKTPVSVIWQVLKARTEGMGLNAAARTFEKAKNTILAWERKFLDLQQVLFLYALVHEFLEVSNTSPPPLMVTVTPFGYMVPRSKGRCILQTYIEFLH